ncbi:lipase 3-like [Danaus plexippus]|uniref:lipase 3-like n=1 Tax=Danaus plexippus TaxID=13037 RepID=UPI002AB2197B|nr:lipase 3-like [Danaus plexippus]
MRAIYLLLCVTLLRGTAGSIFRRPYLPDLDGLIVTPLDYYDQAPSKHPINYRRDSSSEETKERDDKSRDVPSSYRSGKDWNAPLLSAVINQGDQMPYGDVIAWQGVQIAAGPKSPVTNKKDIERIFIDAYQTMQHVTEEDKTRYHEAFNKLTRKEDVNSNATELIRRHNYKVEEHIVKTDDGYILTLFRIQPRKVTLDIKNRPAVFLMHGLLGSADDWLLMGPENSLAYLLADAGYNVWLGNIRGSKYSRHHVSKHVSHPDFWRFSIDEIALHDLPTMIDYVLKSSKQEKLFYVGHSQGTTAFFALTSSRPEYREKIAMMFAMAPMVYMNHVRSPLMRMISPSSRFYDNLHTELGHGEFKPSKEVVHTIGGNMCKKEIQCEFVCSNVNFVVSGFDTSDMEYDLVPVIVRHLPAGASTRQIKQYGQAVDSEGLRKYDYGTDINNMIYGQHQPPRYNMTEVKVPVALYYSEEDWLAHPKDVERLHAELPDVRDLFKVPTEHFSHMDFQFSKHAPQVVYKRLIESIKSHSY